MQSCVTTWGAWEPLLKSQSASCCRFSQRRTDGWSSLSRQVGAAMPSKGPQFDSPPSWAAALLKGLPSEETKANTQATWQWGARAQASLVLSGCWLQVRRLEHGGSARPSLAPGQLTSHSSCHRDRATGWGCYQSETVGILVSGSRGPDWAVCSKETSEALRQIQVKGLRSPMGVDPQDFFDYS